MKKYLMLFRKMNKQKWIVCILLGILLLVIAIPVEPKSENDRQNDSENEEKQEITSGVYEKQLEGRLENIIGQMEGVGKVQVMITLEDEGESVVAQDVNRKTDCT